MTINVFRHCETRFYCIYTPDSPMNNPSVLLVCTSCGGNAESDRQGKVRDGARLFDQLQTLHQDLPLRDDVEIRPVKCMGVCDRPCIIAFVGSGKFTYLFGGLQADDRQTASDILIGANQYAHHPDGILAYRERPDRLRDTIIAKIPTV